MTDDQDILRRALEACGWRRGDDVTAWFQPNGDTWRDDPDPDDDAVIATMLRRLVERGAMPGLQRHANGEFGCSALCGVSVRTLDAPSLGLALCKAVLAAEEAR